MFKIWRKPHALHIMFNKTTKIERVVCFVANNIDQYKTATCIYMSFLLLQCIFSNILIEDII